MSYNSYIADMHLNLHPEQLSQLEKWYEHCRKFSDFFTIAYYPYHMVKCPGGFMAEQPIEEDVAREQWGAIAAFLSEHAERDGFPSFLGYEWQGAGLDGDHNVYFKDDRAPLVLCDRYEELVKELKDLDAIGIPHHLAYSLGNRGKNWETHDELFSPLAEVYSHHGSSERDLTDLPMQRHIHMGPRVDETSVASGIKHGVHMGFIASGDNHEVPAMVKNGRAGVWATDLTKEAIWDALVSRRTFGFTGSKISVWTELGEIEMGGIGTCSRDMAEYRVDICANSRVQRVELYRNGDLEDIRAVKVSPRPSEGDERVRIKFRIECGWGPNVKFFPEFTTKLWAGHMETDATVVSVEPVFASFETDFDIEDEHNVAFTAKSQKTAGGRWMRDSEMRTEGFIFELEGRLNDSVKLVIDGMERSYTLAQLLEGTSIIVFEEQAKRLMKECCGIEEYRRSDSWYHNAYKVRVCQASLSDEYEVHATFDVPVANEETSYYARVVQADGQVAWSSPTWVRHEVSAV